MSSSSSSLLVSVVIAAVALYPLCISSSGTSTTTTTTTAWESFADLFFGFTMTEQIAVMALIFSVSFACASIGSSNSSATSASTSTSSTSTSSTSTSTSTPPSYPLTLMASLDNDTDKFKALYPMLRDELLEHLQTQHELLPEALDWVKSMLDYTVPGGKLNRGITVISVQRTLLQSTMSKKDSTQDVDCLSDTALCQAAALGWAIEFLQAFFLVADDVMDESQTRRGQPCWYKKDTVQMIAINDSFLLESFVFTILKRHFSHTPYYHDLVDLFLTVIQKTEVGQLLDLTSQPMGSTPDLDRFTIQRYQQIVKYKTAYYTFYLPIAMGMITSKVQLSMTHHRDIFATAERICCIMGEYFQIQDDYLDCFGTPEMIGKIGTDIQDNKCSWLIVQALDQATPSQRTILKQNYGSWDDTKVQKVKQVYHDMELPKRFADYEESSYKTIQQELDTLPSVLPRDVFELLLKKIYKRSK